METRWLYTTSENFIALREAADGVCVIPMGCVEKHGLHLPLGTDQLQASYIAWMASQIETVCVFPDFTFGDIGESTPNTPKGVISLPIETQMLLLRQLCEQIVRNGFHTIVIYNGHGGNVSWLNTFLQDFNKQAHNYQIEVINIRCDIMSRIAKAKAVKGLTEDDRALAQSCRERKVADGHAGYSETAYMMAVAPESIRMNRLGIVSGKSLELTNKYKEMGIQIRDGGWEVDYPHWIDSENPIGCNERIGKAAVRLEAERLAQAVRKMKRV